MIKQCKNQGLPDPEFVSKRGVEFRTIIGRDIFTESVLSKLGLNERQLKAVKYVKEKGKIANKEYQALNNCFRNTASNDLADLVKKGILIPSAKKGKGSYYVIAH